VNEAAQAHAAENGVSGSTRFEVATAKDYRGKDFKDLDRKGPDDHRAAARAASGIDLLPAPLADLAKPSTRDAINHEPRSLAQPT
jgi:hypothetical protein